MEILTTFPRRGEGNPKECRPVFDDPAFARLREPFLQICAGLGLAGEETDKI